MLIAIEGIDGAGKNTLVQALRRSFHAEYVSFPRYQESAVAQLIDRALHNTMGDLIDSVYGMATLFALDRAEARDLLNRYAASSEVLLLDRYVASNAAYSAARLKDYSIVDWVAELEFGTLQLPRPALQVWLSTETELAAYRARTRAEQDSTRSLDIYESDADLQSRTSHAYRRLAESTWESPWLVASAEENPDDVARKCIDWITRSKVSDSTDSAE